MRKLIQYIPLWSLSVLATIVISYLLLDRSPLGPDVMLFKGADKVAHCILFCLLTMVYTFDYIRYRLPHHTHTDVELAFATAAATLGGLLEIAQLVMENGRSYELYDWFADIAGAAVGYLIMKFLLTRPLRHYLLRIRHHYYHRHRKRHRYHRKHHSHSTHHSSSNTQEKS